MNTQNRQLDLFFALPGDLPWRDERESMSIPMLSLGKRRRTAPIEWSNRDGSLWCRITGSDFGIATIWDFDVVLWAISQLNEAVEQGLAPAPKIEFQPYDMLRAVGRGVGGQNYKRLTR